MILQNVKLKLGQIFFQKYNQKQSYIVHLKHQQKRQIYANRYVITTSSLQNQLEQELMSIIVSQRTTKANSQEEFTSVIDNKRPKNKYIGLTLKEYFRLHENRSQIGTIEQESSSSNEANTPGFAFEEKIKHIRQNRQRKKIKTQVTQGLFTLEQNNASFHKLMGIHSQQNSSSKYGVKLPYIHDTEGLKKSQIKKNRGKQENQHAVRNKINSFSSTLKQNNQPITSVIPRELSIQDQKKTVDKNHVTLSSFYRLIQKKANTHQNSKNKYQVKKKSSVKNKSLQKKNQYQNYQAKNQLQIIKNKQKIQLQENSMLKSFMITRLAMGNRHKGFQKESKYSKAH